MSIDSVVGSAAVRTNELGVREIVRRLNAGLGPTLVAELAGCKDRRISHEWAKEDGPEPNQAAVRRLMAAIRLWTELSEAHGEHVARLWFIGSNPWLDEVPESTRGRVEVGIGSRTIEISRAQTVHVLFLPVRPMSLFP